MQGRSPIRNYNASQIIILGTLSSVALSAVALEAIMVVLVVVSALQARL